MRCKTNLQTSLCTVKADLSLSIKPEIIQQAKLWAKQQGRSLSAIVEDFFVEVCEDNWPANFQVNKEDDLMRKDYKISSGKDKP